MLYGDNNNWFAAYAFWELKYYGHKDVRILNGGRKKWLAEQREITTAPPTVTPSAYRVAGTDESIRAYKDDVLQVVREGQPGRLVDVRSPDEFT